MKSSRPYLLRALYEWMLDNDATPHIVVEESRPGVVVPAGYGRDGIIVLSISPSAVQNLNMDNDYVSFSARFAGRPEEVWVPMAAVQGIFSKETGEGMQFMTEPGDPPSEAAAPDSAPQQEPSDKPTSGGSKPTGLRVVK